MDPTVFLKFKATPGWENYSSKLASFNRDGQVRQVPELVAAELVKTRPENFEILPEPPAMPNPGAGKEDAGAGRMTLPGETKIVEPEETKAEDQASEAGESDEDSDIVPEQRPGESPKDYGKRFKEWERKHRKDR